ncbi:hypothetical protein GCK72_023194 [Caenorhabditis remanei]|uniref:Uncharacterized protein n=1 Tax=Caenorhabditis remanei TaxID=31234 RepID=A0A6A5FW54_CAERE|nr:hypothetical protein GCK72_023194 [Caenorhabditis remanei]KAF1746737.1 hypothetical protein GCK72_023194 [Caenorhabditis remanei]
MNFALPTALFFVLIATASCQFLQYDDLSVLGEVVEGSGVEGEKTAASSSTTEATTTTVAETTTTVAPSTTEVEATTTTEATTTVAETTTSEATTTTVVSTTVSTSEPTTEETTTTTTEEPTTTEEITTTEVVISETTPTEEVDEESFLGFKKPDLATIYRRLFPFQHHPGQKHYQGQFGQQGGF